MKTFTIEFYQGVLEGADSLHSIHEVLSHLEEQSSCPVIHSAGFDYEVRSLESINNGAIIKGKFAKIRHDDIPHAAAPNQPERELDLADEEGLLEKNHFQYHKGLKLLIWQANRHAGSAQKFADYLSEVSQGVAQLLPVIRQNAIQKLQDNTRHIKAATITIAAAANANNVAKTDFCRDTMSLLAHSNGHRITVRISGNGRSRNPTLRFVDDVRDGFKELMNIADIEAAKISFEDEDGHRDLVDFVADRLKSRQDVAMNGRYPDEQAMYAALEQARRDHWNELRAILGN